MSFNYFVDVFHTVLSDFRGLSIEDFNYFLRTRETFAVHFKSIVVTLFLTLELKKGLNQMIFLFLDFFCCLIVLVQYF